MGRNRSIIVKIHRGKVFFTEEEFLPLTQSNLPMEHLVFTGRPIYWKLWMKSYDREYGNLSVNIQDYDLSMKNKWVGQKPTGPIQSIHFIGASWDHLKACLAFHDRKAREFFNSNVVELPEIKEIQFTHKVRLIDLTIHDGYVSYQKKVRWQSERMEFKIRHRHMMKELEYVKTYFARIIGKKTIDVDVRMGKKNGNIEYINTTCKDLEKINADSIYIIRNFQLDKIKKKLKKEDRENIFLPEFDETDEHFLGNIDDFEKEILFSILDTMEVRNEAQLRYLAELQSDGYKLMLTVQPQFGFVFTVLGDELEHYIWELVNSHATYIWSFPRGVKNKIRKLEHEFLTITDHGRSYYKNAFTNTPDLFFNVVNHRRKQDPMVNHFEKWRVKLVSTLI